MTPFIHQTDLFHPHGDPDDHYDLAAVFALAAAGRLDLRGILLDYPPAHRAGDPGTLAIAQLSHLAALPGVPVAIGTPTPMRHRRDDQRDLSPRHGAAADWLCRTLEACDEPAVINIVGSCTDVAVAALRRPDLFARKCKAVYLNAGSAYPGAGDDGKLEYNVRLNPHAYAAVFDLPCPVYWCPCWHRTERREVGPHGTWYSFTQADILPHLAEPLRNYFLYMLSRSADPKWLRYLSQPPDAALMEKFGPQPRSMWSTVGILHAAGVSPEAASEAFTFEPIAATCADSGEVTWSLSPGSDGAHRFIIHLRDPGAYAATMTAALGKALRGITPTP